MKIFDLVLKDLVQISRDKKIIAFLVIMPILFTVFMGLAYRGDGNESGKDSRLPLAWVEEDPATTLSGALYQRLERSGTVTVAKMAKQDALAAFQNEKVAGVIFIPAGFGETSEQGNIQQIELLADSASPEGQSLYQLLRIPVTQLMSAQEIGRMSVDITGIPDEFTPAFELAWAKWEQSNSRNLVQIEQAVAAEAQSWYGDNPYNQASPGILVQFAIMGLVTSAQILVQERKDRTLQRLITTAMQPWQILTGHMLAMFTVVFLQSALLIVFGQWILGVNYMREPLGTLLISVSLGLWIASMGLLIGVISKTDEHVTLFSMMAMFIFAALGGAWFSLDTSGRLFSSIGRLLPSAWAMTGLQNILIRGSGISSIWLPASFLVVYAIVFLVIAVWQFKRLEI